MKKYFIFSMILFWAMELISQPTDLELERRENLLNLIGKYRSSHYYSGSGDTWTGVTKRIFSYDENLRAIDYVQQQWDFDKWADEIKYVYSYYDNDSLSG